MNRTRHIIDAVVVGAGPAGAATALLLARAGHEIVLLDRSTFPRAKACGDCLSPYAARILDRLHVLTAVEAQCPARLEGWRIIAANGASFEGRFEPAARGDERVRTALALSRERLDHVLVDSARAAGATCIERGRVQDMLRDASGRAAGVRVRGPSGAIVELRARLVIGADGLRSVVARRMGLVRRPPKLRKLSLTAHVRGVADLGAFGEMHLGHGSCVGLAPVEDRVRTPPGRTVHGGPAEAADGPAQTAGPAEAAGCANLTLVVQSDGVGTGVAGDQEAFFWRMVRRFPHLARRLDGATLACTGAASHRPNAARPLLASGPFDWPTRDIVADGVALVGDAAGYYDPFTGQGITHALAGAEILADEADRALRTGDASARSLRSYAHRHRRRFRQSRLLQHLIETVVARPRMAGAVIARLAHAAPAANELIAVTGDLHPPRSLLSPALLVTLLGRAPAMESP